jgi:protein-S-isoprenylcysteine O-methyltransferase Ste14
VVSGPYAYFRNPMAIASFSQGFAVGLWLGSASVLVYVIIGVWIWQCLVRPLEEEDLLLHFGPAYEEYRREVRCWWPRLKQYGS